MRKVELRMNEQLKYDVIKAMEIKTELVKSSIYPYGKLTV